MVPIDKYIHTSSDSQPMTSIDSENMYVHTLMVTINDGIFISSGHLCPCNETFKQYNLFLICLKNSVP